MLKVRNRTELSQVDLSPSFIISRPLSQFSFCHFTHWNILCTKIHNPNKTVKNRFWNGGKSLCFCRIPTALVERGQEFWHRFPAILLMSSILHQTGRIWFNSLYLRQFWFFLQRTLLNVFTICTICWEFIMNYSLQCIVERVKQQELLPTKKSRKSYKKMHQWILSFHLCLKRKIPAVWYFLPGDMKSTAL